jgi:hypothetical protein
MINLGGKGLPFIWIMLLVGCGATTTPNVNIPVRSGPEVAAPVYQAGEQWAYRGVRPTGGPADIRITYNNGKFENDNQKLFDGSIWATVYRPDSNLKPLSFPLAPGKSWNYEYQFTSPTTGWTLSRKAEVKVIGSTAQPVKTQAGQFKATEIRRTETCQGQGVKSGVDELERVLVVINHVTSAAN